MQKQQGELTTIFLYNLYLRLTNFCSLVRREQPSVVLVLPKSRMQSTAYGTLDENFFHSSVYGSDDSGWLKDQIAALFCAGHVFLMLQTDCATIMIT